MNLDESDICRKQVRNPLEGASLQAGQARSFVLQVTMAVLLREKNLSYSQGLMLSFEYVK
jgi:hypothetical protein